MSKKKPKPMNEQTLGIRKRRKKKKEAQSSLCEESPLGSPERDWTRILWDFQNQRDPWEMQERLKS